MQCHFCLAVHLLSDNSFIIKSGIQSLHSQNCGEIDVVIECVEIQYPFVCHFDGNFGKCIKNPRALDCCSLENSEVWNPFKSCFEFPFRALFVVEDVAQLDTSFAVIDIIVIVRRSQTSIGVQSEDCCVKVNPFFLEIFSDFLVVVVKMRVGVLRTPLTFGILWLRCRTLLC